ncbi:hypothetical protein H0N98_00660 [Candidatus Micrarchaeota archaeon]|nr:hypothetical protein [Candidatus Micrarchaeota archaeon]
MVVIAWASWYAITFVIISVVLAIITLAYMIGIGFHLPKLQAWAKDELYQALASAIIAVLLMSFVSTIRTTMISVYGKDPFEIVILDYIPQLIGNLGIFFMGVVEIDVSFALMQSMLFSAMPSQMGFKINPFAGMTTITSFLSLMMEAILTGMAILFGQLTFLIFIQNRLSILFPIGIALRAFPFSRQAGGALIATFLGFYVFYPFLWVFDRAIYNEVSVFSLTSINAGLPNSAGIGSACTDNTAQCTTNTPDIGLNIILWIVSAIAYPVIYYLFVFVVIMSIFNLLTTLVLINELAKLLGSEIDLGGLSGLI